MTTRKQAATPRRSRDVTGSTALRGRPEPSGVGTVWATKQLFYGGQRVRVGEPFVLEKPEDFSPACMTKVDPDVGGADADDARAAEAEAAKRPTGSQEVLS